jgi:mitochondrial chaperone BCS1
MERLDHALLRPGRIDRRFHFGMATESQVRRLFETFYPDAAPGLLANWLLALPAGQHSMAQLQGYLMYFRDDPESAIANADKVIEYTYDYSGGKDKEKDKDTSSSDEAQAEEGL